MHPFGPNIGPCADPFCEYCTELKLNEHLTKSVLEKQGLLIIELRRTNKAHRDASRRWEKRAMRCENVVAELRERVIVLGGNPFAVSKGL